MCFDKLAVLLLLSYTYRGNQYENFVFGILVTNHLNNEDNFQETGKMLSEYVSPTTPLLLNYTVSKFRLYTLNYT